MARIPYPNLEDLPEKVRAAAEKLPPLNIMKMFLNAPTNALPLLSFGQSILTKQELGAHLRELAILRVAHLTGANYEWTQHVPIAKETGVTDAQVEAPTARRRRARRGRLQRAGKARAAFYR